MNKFLGLFKASHFGPTLLVTSISILFALFFHSVSNSLLIGLTIFSGQLIVGWSNDLKDFDDDLKNNRLHKPLVINQVSKKFLINAIIIDLPLVLLINLLGPLGFKGGIISLSGIVVALSYNFFFKFNIFSPIPYALAFGFLPIAIILSANQSVRNWMWITGGLLGIAAHFINVLKDLDKDKSSGINGLPQIVGSKVSIVTSIILILMAIASALFGIFKN